MLAQARHKGCVDVPAQLCPHSVKHCKCRREEQKNPFRFGEGRRMSDPSAFNTCNIDSATLITSVHETYKGIPEDGEMVLRNLSRQKRQLHTDFLARTSDLSRAV